MTQKEGAYEAHAVPDPRLALHAEDSRRTSGNMENTDPRAQLLRFLPGIAVPCPARSLHLSPALLRVSFTRVFTP